jgi:cell division protein FtsB
MSLETWTGARTVRADYEAKKWRATGKNRGWSRKIALSLYVAFALYCVLSIFFGQDGLIAYRKLEDRKAAMTANLLLLAAKRESLNTDLESLKSDPDRAALEARSLGYLRKGETEVILANRVEVVKSIDPGYVLPYAESAGMPDMALKEIAFGAFLAVLAFFCAPRKRE